MRSWTRRTAACATPILLVSFAVAAPVAAAPATVPAPHVSKLGPTAGPTGGGTRVSLIGTGFTHVSKVLFGGRAGFSIRVASSTHLSVVSPAHSAGAQTVQVVTNHGSSTTHTRPFTFVAPPKISSVSTVQPGATVTMTGTGFLHVTGVTFSGDPGTDVHVSSSGSLSVVAPGFASGQKIAYVVVHGRYGDSPAHGASISTSSSDQLPPPTGVAAEQTYEFVHLTWQSPYYVQVTRSPGGYLGGCRLEHVNSCYDEGVTPSTRFVYELAAVSSSGGRELKSSPVTITVTTDQAPPAPQPIGTYQIHPTSATSVRLDWQNLFDYAYKGIEIRRAHGGIAPETASDGVEVTRSADLNGHFVDSGLEPDTEYSYALFAFGQSAYAVPRDRTVTTPGPGAGWSQPTPFDPIHGHAQSISCATSTDCLAVDDAGNAWQLRAGTWSEANPVDYGYDLQSVSCAAITLCVAVDSAGGAVDFDGTSWSGRTQIVDLDDAGRAVISCPEIVFCLASSGEGQAVFNGRSWSRTTAFDLGEPAAIVLLSCSSSEFCVASTRSNETLVDSSGNVSTEHVLPPGSQEGIAGLSCPVNGTCFANDTAQNFYELSRGEWQANGSDPLSPIRGTSSALVLACTSEVSCTIVEDGGASDFDGHQWSQVESTGLYGTLGGLACTGPGNCVTIDEQSVSAAEVDGRWQRTIRFDPQGGAEPIVSCPNSSGCVAVDQDGSFYTYDGANWSRARSTGYDPPGYPRDSLADLSCATLDDCVLVTVYGAAMTYDGISWSVPSQVTPDAAFDDLSAVSCPETDWCLAVGKGRSYVFDGVTWTGPTTMNVYSTDVDCVSKQLCFATNYGSQIDRFDGASWSIDYPQYEDFYGVSCASSNYCVAVINTQTEIVWDGSAWSPRAIPMFDLTSGNGQAPSQLGAGPPICTDNDTCFAPYGRYLFMTTPTAGSAYATDLDQYSDHPTMSCLSSTHCLAFGGGYYSDFRP